jgi:hypothetical protein
MVIDKQAQDIAQSSDQASSLPSSPPYSSIYPPLVPHDPSLSHPSDNPLASVKPYAPDSADPSHLASHTDLESGTSQSVDIVADPFGVDPFQLRNGYKDEKQLAEIRQRRKGNVLEKYQRRQNNVSDALNVVVA